MDDWPLRSLENLLHEPFFADFEIDIPGTPELYMQMDMPTPPSDKGSPMKLSPVAVEFIDKHATTVIDVPTADECPICLDNYEVGVTCLQINNCKHRFCQSCVGVLVDGYTNTDLRCPSCRAVWISSATAGARVPRRNLTQPGDRQTLSAAAHPFVPSRPLVIDEDSDVDTYLQDFFRTARDIEDIRARARNTQISRRQRRQEMRDETTHRRAAERASRPALVDRFRPTGRTLDRPQPSAATPTASNIFAERTSNRTPAQQTQQPANERPSTGRSPANALQLRASSRIPVQHATQVSNERPTTVGNPFSLSMPATSARLGMEFGPPRAERAAITSNTGPAHEPVASIAARLQHDTTEHGIARSSQDVQREQDLNAREKDLNARDTTLTGRATTLNAREDNLNKQEARINRRLTVALQKEKDMKACEERADKVARLAQKQRDEMERLVKRQKEEMDKAMREDAGEARHEQRTYDLLE